MSVLDYARLAAATDADLLSVARDVTDGIIAQGHALTFAGLVMVGAKSRFANVTASSWRALTWSDPRIDGRWILVPSGTIRCGYDDAQIAELRATAPGMTSDDVDPELHLTPFGANERWDDRRWAQADARHVRPFLISALPILGRSPAAHALSLARRRRVLDAPDQPLHLFADELAFATESLRAAVPTRAELEWAHRGAAATVFPWGNALPEWLASDEVPPEEAEATFEHEFPLRYKSGDIAWERASSFGAVDAQASSVWCIDDHDGLIWTGGAAEVFPWQGVGEWLLLTSAAFLRASEGAARTHALRPVIRL